MLEIPRLLFTISLCKIYVSLVVFTSQRATIDSAGRAATGFQFIDGGARIEPANPVQKAIGTPLPK